MNKSFENQFGHKVSESQAVQSANYSVVYDDNGEIRMKEVFFNGQFLLVDYFKKANQDIADAMSEIYTSGKRVVIIDTVFVSGYRLEKKYVHNPEGILSEKSNVLYDPQGEKIAHEYIYDLISGIPEYEDTKKFYFDRSLVPDHCIFDCSFNEDGTLNELYYYNYELNPDGQESFVLLNNPTDLVTLREFTGMSQALAEYYMSPNVEPNF